jgi:hypothetical protein
MARIGFLLHVTAQNMGEGAEKSSLFSPEPQEVGDADTRQLAVERAVDRLLFTGIDQRPASLVPAAGDLDVLVVAVLDPPVDPLELVFELRVEGGECLFDRRQQNRRADLAQDCVLVLPTLRADQVVLEAAKFVAVPDVHVAGFKGLP